MLILICTASIPFLGEFSNSYFVNYLPNCLVLKINRKFAKKEHLTTEQNEAISFFMAQFETRYHVVQCTCHSDEWSDISKIPRKNQNKFGQKLHANALAMHCSK